jgi:hypothetical protein
VRRRRRHDARKRGKKGRQPPAGERRVAAARSLDGRPMPALELEVRGARIGHWAMVV